MLSGACVCVCVCVCGFRVPCKDSSESAREVLGLMFEHLHASAILERVMYENAPVWVLFTTRLRNEWSWYGLLLL